MATKTSFYLDGSLVNPPFNWQEMLLELNYDKDRFPTTNQLSITDWEWVRENAKYIRNYMLSGKIYIGLLLKIEIQRGSITEKIFDGYIDLTQDVTMFSDRDIKIKTRAKSLFSVDWLNDNSEFTYEYLFSIGEVKKTDFVFIPYVLNSVPDYLQSAVATFSVFVLTQEIKKTIQEISELTTDLANVFTAANSIIKAILYIAYLAILIAAMIKLIADLILFIIQPIKYHAGMRTRDLLRIGAAHLGLTFKSEIFEQEPFSKEVIIPFKSFVPPSTTNDKILGFLNVNVNEQQGFYKGTFADLLRAMKIKHNAKIVVTTSGELHLLRVDKSVGSPQFKIPDIYQPEFSTNADELKSNYIISFQTDLSDKNTIQQFKGTSYQIVTSNKNSPPDLRLNMVKGLEEIKIPFALAKRKESLTLPETIIFDFLKVFDFLINELIKGINVLIKAANFIIKLLNKVIKALKVVGIRVNWQIKPIPTLAKINTSALINNRIGMMMIEYDQFQIDKCLILDEGSQAKFNKVNANNSIYLSAKYAYENFYFVNSFLPSIERPYGNQCLIYQYPKVPFVYNNYLQVKANSLCYTKDGKTAIMQTNKWNPYQQHAEMVIRKPYLFAPDLIETYIEPDGR